MKPKRNALARITYRAYFFDHTEFDSSKGKPIVFKIGNLAWPEGLSKGIEKMRKNESAKIRIKKKMYGYGRKENIDKLIFPPGLDEALRQRLVTKGLIYEVKLLDWVDRADIDGKGNFLKTVVKAAPKKEWELPADRDEVTFKVTLKASVDEQSE